MRKLIPLMLFSLIVFAGFLPMGLANVEIESKGTAWRKLQRGAINIATAPCEVAYEMHNVRKQDQAAIPTWVVGMGKGAFYTFGRGLTGVYDIITFPFAVPSGYNNLLEPEFGWDRCDKDYVQPKHKTSTAEN